MIWPWIAGGTALAAAGYLLWKLLQRKLRDRQQQQEHQQPSDSEGEQERSQSGTEDQQTPGKPGEDESESDGDDAGDESGNDARRRRSRADEDDQYAMGVLNQAVSETRFTTANEPVIIEVKVGERWKESIIPADAITIRPIQSIHELPAILPEVIAYDEDTFMVGVADNSLPIMQHLQRHDVVEKKEEPTQRDLVFLADCSGSMDKSVGETNANRTHYLIRLCEKQIDNCIKQRSGMILVLFGNWVEGIYPARTEEELLELKGNLHRIIHCSSGTNIDAALAGGMDIVEKLGSDEPHIMLATDGTESINARETQQRMRQLGVQLHVVSIGQDHHGLRQIAHRYHCVRK